MVVIDHVIVAVRDFEVAAERLWNDFGLASINGGVHPDWGTGNRIVPLGPNYVELLGVIDPAKAAKGHLGRLIVQTTSDRLIGWALRTDDLDAAARRTGRMPRAGSRLTPEGRRLSWRSVHAADEHLPFFIAWDDPDTHPGTGKAAHRGAAHGICWVEIGGDSARVQEWIGVSDLPIRFVPGPPGIRAAGIATADGEIVLR